MSRRNLQKLLITGVWLSQGIPVGKHGAGDVKFQEDMQVIYDDGWTGAKAVYSGHRGSADHRSRRTEIGPLDNSYADNRGQI